MESKAGSFGNAVWRKLKRGSIFDKMGLIATQSSQKQKEKYDLLFPKLKRAFDLRNRLAHFKDEDQVLADSPSLNQVSSIIKNLPMPDISEELQWSKCSNHAQAVTEADAWLNSVYTTYCKRHNIEISTQRHVISP